jgi:hypothetical protein
VSGRIAILGSSLSALVVAERLSAAGHDVWIFGRRERAGGRFRGTFHDGRSFDLAALALTARSDRLAPGLSDFDVTRPGDATRFGHEVARWAAELGVPLVDLAPPTLHLADRTVLPDLLVGRGVHGLSNLAPSLRQAIAAELRLPTADTAEGALSLRALSLAHHGATIHDALIEPFVRARTGELTESLPAEAARVLGLPIYARAELLAAVDGHFTGERRQQGESTLVLRRPEQGTVRALVTALVEQLARRPRVRWIADVVERLETRGTGLVVHRADSVVSFDVWCAAASAPRLLPLLGLADAVIGPEHQVTTTVVCATVNDARSQGGWHVAVDPELPTEVVVQPALAAAPFGVTIDWGVTAIGDGELEARTANALVRLGIAADAGSVVLHGVRRTRDLRLAPTSSVVAAHAATSQALAERIPGVHRLGAASSVLQPTLDEEIVGGLAAAEAINERLGARGLRPVSFRTPYAPSVRVIEATPAVSIVLALSDDSAGHARALHALLAQGVGHVDVIAVPVGEARAAREVIDRFAAQHPELPIAVLSPLPGETVAPAMHRAVARARGRALVTLQADDLLVPTALADAMQQLDTNPLLDAVVGDRLVPEGRRTVLRTVTPGSALDLSGRVRAGVYRRVLWDRVGGWRLNALDPSRDFWVAATLAGAVGVSLGVPFVSTPDAGDRMASRMLGHDLEARAEIVIARAAAFDAHTVAVAMSVRAGWPICPLVEALPPAEILIDGLAEWGDAASIEGSIVSIARGWDAARGHAAAVPSVRK